MLMYGHAWHLDMLCVWVDLDLPQNAQYADTFVETRLSSAVLIVTRSATALIGIAN